MMMLFIIIIIIIFLLIYRTIEHFEDYTSGLWTSVGSYECRAGNLCNRTIFLGTNEIDGYNITISHGYSVIANGLLGNENIKNLHLIGKDEIDNIMPNNEVFSGTLLVNKIT